MPRYHAPRKGSLQFRPRKRAKKYLPRVNWKPIEEKTEKRGALGFIGYKAGMVSAIVKDLTPNSLTKNKQIVLPVSIIECPPMRVLAVRFYKGNNAALDILAENLNKELKRKIKTPKKPTRKIDDVKIGDYDDVKIIVYTLVKNTGIKKTPDIAEMGLKGTMQEKFDIAKDLMKKEIKIGDIFEKGQLIDVHSVTKGKGFAGPVKRFGLSLKQHKSEKGVRRPGSLGPWHPARVTFRAPLAGQLGFFSRIQFNNKIIDLSSISSKDINPKSGFQNYGTVRGDYLVVKGSVSGSRKRALLLTFPMRTRKRREKEIFELVGVEK